MKNNIVLVAYIAIDKTLISVIFNNVLLFYQIWYKLFSIFIYLLLSNVLYNFVFASVYHYSNIKNVQLNKGKINVFVR